jgi:hypothetical protein
MAAAPASIIVAVKCDDREPTFIRVFAEPGDLPLDTYLRVCEAHALSGDVPDYVCATGFVHVAA